MYLHICTVVFLSEDSAGFCNFYHFFKSLFQGGQGIRGLKGHKGEKVSDSVLLICNNTHLHAKQLFKHVLSQSKFSGQVLFELFSDALLAWWGP